MSDEITFVIKGRPITKKNHQQIRKNRKTGKRYIGQSDRYNMYATDALWQLPHPDVAINDTINLKCIYYMPTHHVVDLVNLLEATCDILKEANIIKDDNSNIVAGHDGSRVRYDKENPRVEITITKLEE